MQREKSSRATQKPPARKLRLDKSAGSPREIWNDYFSKRKPKLSDVNRAILQLHRSGKHEHVIAAIESALVNGQSQTWMYEVLAISMEIAGRPKDEVERVLLSRVDFTAVDVPSMLFSAAYLTRFGANTQALTLYRQASRLAPHRPEPYVLALKLARQQKDFDAIRWAATGILTTAWIKNYAQLHRDAENAAVDAEQQLRAAGRIEEADALKSAMDEARKRDLIVKLTWAGDGDLDLFVEEPPGIVCSFENPQSPGGGVHVHDGYGPKSANCYEEYLCAFGVSGNYRIRVRHVGGNIVGKRAQLTVTRYHGTSKQTARTFIVHVAKRDKIVRLSLSQGRRTELVPIEKREVVQIKRRRGSLRKMLGRMDADSHRAGRRFDESRRHSDRHQRGRGSQVGFQPIISVLSEGVTSSAMAVVSGDRRYVRISLSPVITSITDVFTFSFQSRGNQAGNAVGGNAGATSP